jgi:dTDP-4-amino-4,6-dideoxygalactose transaminase
VTWRRLNLYYGALERRHARWLVADAVAAAWSPSGAGEARWSARFEEAFRASVGARAAFAFPSARSALYATLKALGIGPGDEVVLTGFTCVAVPNPVVYLGARPVYADIDPRTFNAPAAAIEERVTPRTKAIVVQHTFGNPAEAQEIAALAARWGVTIIEDCCLALGSRHGGEPLGRHGQAAIVSFELSKTLSAGWGGLVWVHDDTLARALGQARDGTPLLPRWDAIRRSLQVAASWALYHPAAHAPGRYVAGALYRLGLFHRSTGADEARSLMPPRFLHRLADVHWRVLLDQLAALPAAAGRRADVAARYRAVLERHGVHTFPAVAPGAEPAWVRFPFLVDDRPAFRRAMARVGVEVGQWFDHPVSGAREPAAVGYVAGACPTAELVARHVVNLPVHRRVTDADVRRITETLDRYLAAHPGSRTLSERVNAGREPAPRPIGIRE